MGCEGRVDKVIEGGMNNTKDFPKKSRGKLLLQNLSKIYVYMYINRVKMELLYNGP